MPVDMLTKLWNHQQEAVDFLSSHPTAALFMEMGTGKTRVVLDRIFQRSPIVQSLVVAPLSVCLSWRDEITTHVKDGMTYSTCIFSGSKTIRKHSAEIRSFLHVMSYETVKMLADVYPPDWWSKYKFVALDESTRIKNPSAQVTKICHTLFRTAPERVVMSGMPITQNLLDIWGQMYFVDEDILTRSYWQFRGRYFVQLDKAHETKKHIWLPRGGTYQTILETIAPITFWRKKSECLSLPDKVYTVRYVSMDERQIALYNELLTNFEVHTGEQEFSTDYVVAKMLYMQEICNGWLKDENISMSRIHSLMDVLEEVQGKVIVWFWFKNDGERISQALQDSIGEDGRRAPFLIHGEVPVEKRSAVINAWRTSNEGVLVIQTRCGGLGLTLTDASTAIYFSNHWSVEARRQSEDRIHRAGQKNVCTYIDLVCPDTIDHAIVQALRKGVDLCRSVQECGSLIQAMRKVTGSAKTKWTL